ncbi:hypothetical protein D7B24_008534 [Verticillium nonalfalfae]|uniref:glutaminase n=1 Tax=Verticillium nonalfalfae TaxID=1051616 RepID=A0A3M9Y4L2_9PEZI|nr:uncharacterized protein D7B24_008534 [Verticillium nonalfalfae]RNJ55397.1 hypothetical protein D7B24_008534 [Verticillium nonalfalfae]
MPTIGVLSLQGGFQEHLTALARAAASLSASAPSAPAFTPTPVRTPADLARCAALLIPGGESTTIAHLAAESALLDPLRAFVAAGRPVWGTCAGAILLADEAVAASAKKGGQALIGGLAVRVHRNHFGRQIESFVADLELPFLRGGHEQQQQQQQPARLFSGVFIRAPVVEAVLDPAAVETLARLPGRKTRAGIDRPSESDGDAEAGDIVAVRQGNIFATSFHPELTDDIRVHVWWLGEVANYLEKETA